MQLIEILYNYITVIAPDNTVTIPTADFTIQLNLQALEVICDASPSYDPDGIAMYYWNLVMDHRKSLRTF
jgi:hypothetical protein